MIFHDVRVYPSTHSPAREEQLAWKLAALATDRTPIDNDVTEMIINRVIDNASVAIAAINRRPVVNARSQALAHPRPGGATLFGLGRDFECHAEWAGWANCTAVRELDMHDTFLAADYSHPGDNIPPILAVAQQKNRSGRDLIRALATAYEVHVDLVRAICLHKHKIDHIAHLCPASAAGMGTLLDLDTETTYQAIQQAVHTSFSTRQSRKGEISSWKAYAPAHSAKLAVEAVDRAMRGEGAPSPIYEGEDSVIAWLLDGPDAHYSVPLPEPGESKRAILESYTKEHSAEYQAQAVIDLAFRIRRRIENTDAIEKVILQTSHHTHYVIGTGSGDPQKLDPEASRETLDHSIMYIFAVALEDGQWHHVDSYARSRATRPSTVKLWQSIKTEEDPRWTERYHATDPGEKAFGARALITMKDGTTIEDELAVADAHPLGASPMRREGYLNKFRTLTESIVESAESERFLAAAEGLATLDDLRELTVALPKDTLQAAEPDERGIF